jgi:hypothetical protein
MTLVAAREAHVGPPDRSLIEGGLCHHSGYPAEPLVAGPNDTRVDSSSTSDSRLRVARPWTDISLDGLSGLGRMC